MALDIAIFGLVLTIAILFYLLGLFSKTHFLFLMGCVLLLGSGAILFIFDGLITGYYYSTEGLLQSIIVTSSSVGIYALAFVLIAVGVISVLVFDFSIKGKSKSPFHY
jgi:hypothetical protein